MKFDGQMSFSPKKVWQIGGTVSVALGLRRQSPPGLAGGKKVVEARGKRPAQTPGYVVGRGQVVGVSAEEERLPEGRGQHLPMVKFDGQMPSPPPKSQALWQMGSTVSVAFDGQMSFSPKKSRLGVRCLCGVGVASAVKFCTPPQHYIRLYHIICATATLYTPV